MFVNNRPLDLRAGEIVRTPGEVGALENGPVEFRVPQICTSEIHVRAIGAAEIGGVQIGVAEIRPANKCAAEVDFESVAPFGSGCRKSCLFPVTFTHQPNDFAHIGWRLSVSVIYSIFLQIYSQQLQDRLRQIRKIPRHICLSVKMAPSRISSLSSLNCPTDLLKSSAT